MSSTKFDGRYHCDQFNSQKLTVMVSWLKFVTNTGMLHVNNPLTLMVASLAPHKVLLVGLFANRCQSSRE